MMNTKAGQPKEQKALAGELGTKRSGPHGVVVGGGVVIRVTLKGR